MKKPAKLLILNEIKVEQTALAKAVTDWHHFADKSSNGNRCLYISDNDLLEIGVFEEGFGIEKSENASPLLSLGKKIRNSLLSDWKKQILELKDIVKPQPNELPVAPFLQLRHIEVPLRVYDDYINWRRDTIFAYVNENPAVDSFVAYHSIFSAEPGVTFFSGFSCARADYLNSFDTPKYQQIVKDAGNQFICGGAKSLYTKVYSRV